MGNISNFALLAEQSRLGRDMAELGGIAAGIAQQPEVPAENMSFSQVMMDAVRGVDAHSKRAGDMMADVDSGKSDDLVGAMLMSQEAGLSFSMLMQVRNKVASAVDDLIKMQI